MRRAATTLTGLFETQTRRRPDAEAVAFDEQSLSYEELNQRSNRLAHRLIGMGIGPEDLVGIRLARSAELIVAVLGILKAGAAYLPMDPNYPKARTQEMLNDARPAAVLTAEWFAGDGDGPVTNPTDADRVRPLSLHNPAYVIFTSGSTGRPKGVVVTHAGIANLALAQAERLGVTAESRVALFASLNFDASLSEIAMTMVSGATLVVLGEEQRGGDALRHAIVAQAVTHATLPPAVLPTLEPNATLPLQGLIVAGEACSAELAAAWSPHRRMINAYGPTETTVCATMSGPLSGGQTPSIGGPLWNTRVYVASFGK
jgi:amino acid adenylation domain-containing protein